jgi:hypothetical protein
MSHRSLLAPRVADEKLAAVATEDKSVEQAHMGSRPRAFNL